MWHFSNQFVIIFHVYILEVDNFIRVNSRKSSLDTIPKSNQQDFMKLLNQYKFHLSFENAHCSEYVTEKLFNPLLSDTIPIGKIHLMYPVWYYDL